MFDSRIVRLASISLVCAMLLPSLLGCAAPGPTVTPVGGFEMPTAAPTIASSVAQAPANPEQPAQPDATPYPAPPTSAPQPTVYYPEPGERGSATEPTEPAEPTEVPAEPAEIAKEPAAYPEPEQPADAPAAPVEPEAYPEPEEAAEPAAEEPANEPALTVMGTPFTMAELESLEQATAEIDGEKFDGVAFLAVLAAAGADVENVNVVASDGYAANVALADVPAEGILSYEADGTLRLIIPGLAKATRVRDVVEIVEGMPAEPEAAAPIETKAPIGGPVDLVDAAGREVHLESLPQRIVVVGKGPHMSLHILYMFEEGRERVVGSEARSATPSEFLDLVFDDFSDMTYLAANPNIEQIATLQPDLVIMKGMMDDKTSGALAQVDIPCMFVGLESVDMFFQDLANIGIVLGNEERADEIAAFYQERLDRLAEGTADLTDDEKPRCLLVEYFDRGGEVSVKVPAAAWMQTVELETAGGLPVWLDSAEVTSGWTVVNLEQIAAWDPDKIFVIVWYTADPQEVINGFKTDDNWIELSAIQNDEIYAFPRDIFGWDQPEPRWILGMEWLATQIYPDEFADIDMTAEVMHYFATMYDMDHPTTAEIVLPRLEMDVR